MFVNLPFQKWCLELIPRVLQRLMKLHVAQVRRLVGLVAIGCLFAGCLTLPCRAASDQRSMTPSQLLTLQIASVATPSFTINTRVAPLFAHGRGFGLNGWDASEGSVFFAKDDACTLIIEEARAAGLHFSQDAPTLYDILTVPGRPADESLPTPTRALTLDGIDTQKKVAFVFVTAGDANNWRKKCGHGNLGEGVDIFSCASSMRDILAGAPLDGYYAIFYDPAVTMDDLPPSLTNDVDPQTTGDLTNEASNFARAQLRQQVRDFIGWLKLRTQ